MKTTIAIDTTRPFTSSVAVVPQFELGEAHTIRIEATGLDTGAKVGLAAYTLAGDPLFAVHDIAWTAGVAEASFGTSTVQAVQALGERQRMEIIVGIDEYTGTAPSQVRKTLAQFKTVLYRDSYAGSENPETIQQAVGAVATATAQAGIATQQATTATAQAVIATASAAAADADRIAVEEMVETANGTKMNKLVSPEGNFVLANDATGDAQKTTVTKTALESQLPPDALAKLLSTASSSGRLWGFEITNSFGNLVGVGPGQGVSKTATATLQDIPASLGDGQASPVELVTVGPYNEVSLADGYNLIYWDASAGALTSCLREDFAANFDFVRDFTVGSCYYDASTHTKVFRLCGMNDWNFPRRVQMFGEERFPVERASGLMVGNPYGLQISMTEGVIWAELVNRFPIAAFDSHTGDYFTAWAYNATDGEPGMWANLGEWQELDPTYYNNPENAGGLQELTANRYGVHWIYVVHDGSVHVVYGTGDYTLAQAQNAAAPSRLPGLLAAYATLIGKAIVKKNATTLTSLQSPFTTQLGLATVNEHNDLSGLQGGAGGDYQHLTTAQVAAVNGAVRHDTAQALTTAAKAQGRQNLGLSGSPVMVHPSAAGAAINGNGGAYFRVATQGSAVSVQLAFILSSLAGHATTPTTATFFMNFAGYGDTDTATLSLIFGATSLLDVPVTRVSASEYTIGNQTFGAGPWEIKVVRTGSTSNNYGLAVYVNNSAAPVATASSLTYPAYVFKLSSADVYSTGWIQYAPHINYWVVGS